MATKRGSQQLKLPILSEMQVSVFAKTARGLAAHNERLALIHLISSQPGCTQLEAAHRRVQELESGLAVNSGQLAMRLNLLANNAINALKHARRSQTRSWIALALIVSYTQISSGWELQWPQEARLLRNIAEGNGEERVA